MQQVEVLERPTPVQAPKHPRAFIAVAIAFILVLAVVGILMARHWPFTRAAVTESLQQEAGSQVEIGTYRQTYFPHPGGVAENVTFLSPDHQSAPPITIQKLTLEGSYLTLLAQHLTAIRAEGLRVLIPPAGQRSSGPNFFTSKSTVSIGQFVADGAEITFASDKPGQQPLVFRLPKFTLSSLERNHPVSFRSTVLIPLPPGKVDVSGKYGPIKPGSIGQTPIFGSYTLQDADLSVFGGVAGKISAKGRLSGVLQHITTHGEADTPDFMVSESRHTQHLNAEYDVVVNGLNGDVGLQNVIANFGKTTLIGTGKIEGESEAAGAGKTLSLNVDSQRARIQDLLHMFASSNPPAMLGPITFRAKVELPPENRPFLKRVQLQGDFGISGAQYTDPKTQKNVDVASAKARGEADKVEDQNDKDHNDSYDPGRVLSDVKGHVVLRNAVATLTDVTFDVPGASALVNGTYDLPTERVNLEGNVKLQTELSKATTGVKSILLKIIQPFTVSGVKKGSVVHLKLTGTYHKPNFLITPVTK